MHVSNVLGQGQAIFNVDLAGGDTPPSPANYLSGKSLLGCIWSQLSNYTFYVEGRMTTTMAVLNAQPTFLPSTATPAHYPKRGLR